MKISAAEEAFERWRKIFGAVAAPIVFIVTYSLTPNLTFEGRRLAAILASMAVLWMTETIPLPATALLAGVLCISLGVAPLRQVWAYYANEVIFLFIGSFILARAMTLHRLDRRIALAFLSIPWVGRSPARIMAGMGLITCLISMWVSNSATTSMMLPVAIGVLGALHTVSGGGDLAENPRWRYGTGMMLMIAYASAVGGIGTPVGSPPNLICISLLKNTANIDIGFLEWMIYTIPLMLLMMFTLQLLLYRLHPCDTATHNLGHSIGAYVQKEQAELGPWTAGQINTLIAFAVAIALWLLPGILKLPIWGSGDIGQRMLGISNWFDARFHESVAAVIAALLLFILPVSLREGEFTISWNEAVKIDWGTILLFGGGLALGTLMFEKGVAKAMGDALTAHLGLNSIWSITALAVGIGIILSEATSNTAASNMVIPVVISICQKQGISPLAPALGACLGASYGFMLPVSTPPNAIVYGSGLVSIPAMMRAGILFDILGFGMIWCGLRVMAAVGILPA